MTTDQLLEALTARFGLADAHVAPLLAYHQLLCTDPTAPTTVTDPGRIIDEHFADALVALELPELGTAQVAVDLGSGAGLPGLPLAIALPHLHVTLLDSLERKAAFLRRAVECAGVSNAAVVTARAEAWPAGLDHHDAVLVRAVAPLAVLLEYAAPLLRRGGHLIAWKGDVGAGEAADAQAAADVLGLRLEDPLPVKPWPGAQRRSIWRATKVAATPPTYPRRPGMARKRPLHA